MDQPPAVALTAFADAWPRAIETEIGAAPCAIGAGRTLTLTFDMKECCRFFVLWKSSVVPTDYLILFDATYCLEMLQLS